LTSKKTSRRRPVPTYSGSTVTPSDSSRTRTASKTAQNQNQQKSLTLERSARQMSARKDFVSSVLPRIRNPARHRDKDDKQLKAEDDRNSNRTSPSNKKPKIVVKEGQKMIFIRIPCL